MINATGLQEFPQSLDGFFRVEERPLKLQARFQIEDHLGSGPTGQTDQ